jgi:CRP-like cAMP-binding protein
MEARELKERFAPHFDPLTDADLGCIIDALVVQSVPAETRMITHGEWNDRLYLIVDGEVGIHITCTDTTLQLGSRAKGSWIGELGLIEPGPASATVDATTDVVAWVLTHDAYQGMQQDSPGAAAALTELVCKDIAERFRQSDVLTFRREEDRVVLGIPPEAPEETLLGHLKSLLGLATGGRR